MTHTPTRLSGLVAWFVRSWESEVPRTTHASGVEWEGPGRIVRSDGTGVSDPGGGNEQGAPRWNGEARAYVFGGTKSYTDTDGWYVLPMHWTVDWLGMRHPLKAALLRMIGRGGDWHRVSVTCPACDSRVLLPDEYAEAVARDALGLAYRHYERAPRGQDGHYYGDSQPVA